MLWIIYISLIILGLFLKRSRVYDYCVISFLGFLAWANTDAADYKSIYLPIYLNPSESADMDTGWVVLCEFGKFIRLSYNGFACVLTVLALLLLRWAGLYISTNTSFMLSLFLIYPGLISIVQFRQFIASSIGVVALILLFAKVQHRYIFFIVLASFACLIHRSAAVLFLLLLWPLLRAFSRKGRTLATIFVICSCLGVISNAETISAFFFGEKRTYVYLSAYQGATAAGPLGGLRNVLLIIIMAIMTYYLRQTLLETYNKRKFQSNIDVSYGISILNISMLVLIPFVYITNDFMRFERYAFTYALLLFAMLCNTKSCFKFFLNKFSYAILCFIFAFSYVANSFDSIYGALLSFETLPSFFL